MKHWVENSAMARQSSSSGGNSELAAPKREEAESRKELASLRRSIQSAPSQRKRASTKGKGKGVAKALAIYDAPKGKGKGRKESKRGPKGQGKTPSQFDLLAHRPGGTDNFHARQREGQGFCVSSSTKTPALAQPQIAPSTTPVLAATVLYFAILHTTSFFTLPYFACRSKLRFQVRSFLHLRATYKQSHRAAGPVKFHFSAFNKRTLLWIPLLS